MLTFRHWDNDYRILEQAPTASNTTPHQGYTFPPALPRLKRIHQNISEASDLDVVPLDGRVSRTRKTRPVI